MTGLDRQLMTFGETARFLRVGCYDIFGAVVTGRLPVVISGGRLLIDRVALMRRLNPNWRSEEVHREP